ncbi:MAG: glycosyl transferase [Acidobacteria bacterium]|nr:MAG: glycosyl transferase [Acidobacteriota bacterium]
MSVRILPISVPADVSVPEPEIVLELTSPPETASAGSRVVLGGKFLWVGQKKLYVRGVTYGTFRPSMDGSAFPSPRVVEQDFSLMSANGVNAVRTYTTPPHWLLEIALRCNLRVLVGMQGERHYAFLHEKKMVRQIRNQVRSGARACAGHRAVLGYLVANEIPASIVRWHGARAVEKFVKQLHDEVKEQDPEALVSYANYPSTEYLDLSFLDLVCFNVFLESQDKYEAYLARLQNLAGNRPLLVTEIGLDSHRNGDKAQAACLDWQIRKTFAAGCAGAFVYAWTDEWYRGGEDVNDWDFGLTSRTRQPKQALSVVRKVFEEVPFSSEETWPKISVVVCTFNGRRTIRECLEGIGKLHYPNYETIVVDDGSTDGAGDIAAEYDVRLIRTENQGLSAARNLGWQSATGEIVAYIDDDASPDPDWLTYLAAAFLKEEYAGVGGPNIPVPDDGDTANCIANSPGGPAHVLLSDCEAEHIPGCNMAFRRSWLEVINGFDPQFRQAGDDVDVCWRTRDRGGKLGFSPAAMVWHHYRRTVRAYWKQQMGYGKAEAMLERKWPEKYNSGGYATWAGHIYVNGIFRSLSLSRGRIYQGTWGTAGYARLYEPAPNLLNSLPLTHEWQLTNLVLAALCGISMFWGRLLGVLPIAVVAFVLSLVPATSAAAKVRFPESAKGRFTRFRLRVLTGLLHLMQPLTRLWSRLVYSLTAWRIRRFPTLSFPWPRMFQLWSERWLDSTEVLASLESVLRSGGAVVRRGGDYDSWDLEIRGGLFGGVRVRTVTENYGCGKHMLRLCSRPWFSISGAGTTLLLMIACFGALLDHAVYAASILAPLSVMFGAITFRSAAVAVGAIHRALIKLDFERA